MNALAWSLLAAGYVFAFVVPDSLVGVGLGVASIVVSLIESRPRRSRG